MTTAMGYNMKIVRGELTFCGGGGGIFPGVRDEQFFCSCQEPPFMHPAGKTLDIWSYWTKQTVKKTNLWGKTAVDKSE